MQNMEPLSIDAKPWGFTALLYADGISQVNRICVCPGGYSSKHLHRSKTNVFVVCDGELLVYLFDVNLQPIDQHVLRSGDSLTVPPTVIHQFCARLRTEGYELYYAPHGGELQCDDIERFSTNGTTRATQDCDCANERTQPRSGA